MFKFDKEEEEEEESVLKKRGKVLDQLKEKHDVGSKSAPKTSSSEELQSVSDGKTDTVLISSEETMFEIIQPKIEELIESQITQFLSTFKPEEQYQMTGIDLFQTIRGYIEPLITAKYTEFQRIEGGFKQPHGTDLHDLFETLLPLIRSEIMSPAQLIEDFDWKSRLNFQQLSGEIASSLAQTEGVQWMKDNLIGIPEREKYTTKDGKKKTRLTGKGKGQRRLQEAVTHLLEFIRST